MSSASLDSKQPYAPILETLGAEGVARDIAIATDPQHALARRIEAYDDIIDAEVGDTSLSRARHLERATGLRQLYLKFEAGNPTGTQKDRIAFAQARDALRRGYDTITVATCGNYGAAVALAAVTAGLRCRIYMPARYHSRRIDEMRATGAELQRVDGDYEQTVVASAEAACKEGLYDANPGGANTPLQLAAYAEIAHEIYDELRDAPAAIAVPVSNGTTLVGIYRGFVSLHRRGKTSRIPRIVAGSSFRKNPIVEAVISKKTSCSDLDPARIRETIINEPLINWRSADGQLALTAIRASNGWAAYASDQRMKSEAKRLRTLEGLAILPAATAGLLALLSVHAATPLPADRYVAVMTGRHAA
jgi:threonine synthase